MSIEESLECILNCHNKDMVCIDISYQQIRVLPNLSEDIDEFQNWMQENNWW
jgi:hypothetical protein